MKGVRFTRVEYMAAIHNTTVDSGTPEDQEVDSFNDPHQALSNFSAGN